MIYIQSLVEQTHVQITILPNLLAREETVYPDSIINLDYYHAVIGFHYYLGGVEVLVRISGIATALDEEPHLYLTCQQLSKPRKGVESCHVPEDCSQS